MLVEHNNYQYYTLLEELLASLTATVNSNPWRNILPKLLELPKEDTTDDVWWVLSTDNDTQKYETNFSIEYGNVNESKNGSSWLVIMLADEGWKETHDNEIIDSVFFKEKQLINKLPGIKVATLCYISDNTVVQPHVDGYEKFEDDSYFYTILLNVHAPISDDLSLIVEDKKFSVAPNSILGFDAHYNHGVENFSGSDWIFLSLRIQRKYFENNIK
jgi:hypothetical protein